jgi:hypothetical protein
MSTCTVRRYMYSCPIIDIYRVHNIPQRVGVDARDDVYLIYKYSRVVAFCSQVSLPFHSRAVSVQYKYRNTHMQLSGHPQMIQAVRPLANSGLGFDASVLWSEEKRAVFEAMHPWMSDDTYVVMDLY